VVVKASNRNAFVVPNGKIVVFTGILPVAKSEAGLAAIIGHEVAHVLAKHGAERVSQVLLTQTALTAADAVLAARNSRNRASISAALSLGAQYGVLLPFSREHESEADRIGLLYMAKAGYDPVEAVGVWERMHAAGGSGPWEFLSTHPSPETRIAQIRQWLPEANLYYAHRDRPLPLNIAELQKASTERASKIALAPVALRPSYEQGFWYQITTTSQPNPVTYRFVRKESCAAGQCLVLESDAGETSLMTLDMGLVEVRNAKLSAKFEPPLRVIQWPLKVGDAWTDKVAIEQSTGQKTERAPQIQTVR
jgi:hypothetical protein